MGNPNPLSPDQIRQLPDDDLRRYAEAWDEDEAWDEIEQRNI